MTSRLLFGFTGPLWVICVVVIGLSPPISDGRYAQRMPLVGWAIVAFGVVMIVKAVRESSQWGRYWPIRRPKGREQITSIVLTAIAVGVGGWSVWHGISAGLPSSVCAGLVLLSVVPMLLPRGG